MNERDQNLRLGIFVISGIALLLAMLFYFGLSDVFTSKVELVTYFSESVQGLNVGSSVKYRGVPAGTVSALTIDMTTRQVWVTMKLEPRYFYGGKKPVSPEQFLQMLQKEIQRGLRCRLEFAGITGMKFIDFDYFAPASDEDTASPTQYPGNAKALYIASVPSTMKDLSSALSSSLERLSSIRFEDIAEEMERSLERLSGLLSDPALRSAINRINDAAANLEVSTNTIARVLDEKRLVRILDSLEKDMVMLNALGNQLSSAANAMKLPESTALLRSTLESLMDNSSEINNSLSKFNQTLESVKMLTDYLGTDPNAIITGKKTTPLK